MAPCSRHLTPPVVLCTSLQVCHSLLPVLVRRKPLTRHLLQLPSWQKLAEAFASRQAALSMQLSQKLQRALSRCLCLAASGFDEQGPAQQYVSHLLLQTAKEITGLAGQEQRQLAAAAQRADVQLQVGCRSCLWLSCHSWNECQQVENVSVSWSWKPLAACLFSSCWQQQAARGSTASLTAARPCKTSPLSCPAGVHDARGAAWCRHCRPT